MLWGCYKITCRLYTIENWSTSLLLAVALSYRRMMYLMILLFYYRFEIEYELVFDLTQINKMLHFGNNYIMCVCIFY